MSGYQLEFTSNCHPGFKNRDEYISAKFERSSLIALSKFCPYLENMDILPWKVDDPSSHCG